MWQLGGGGKLAEDKEIGSIRSGITYIRPCVTEAGRVSAETRLSSHADTSSGSSPDVLDSLRLCWVLNTSQIFSRVKCSEKLGIAKIEIDGKTVVVSKGGRINIRMARDRGDALVTTRLVSRALWPAMICSNCGRAVMECVSGFCAGCKPAECRLLTHGPMDPTATVSERFELKTVREILAELETRVSTGFHETRLRLDETFQAMKSAAVAVSEGDDSIDVESAVKERLDVAKSMALRLVAEGEGLIDVSGGLILLGVAANLEALSHTIHSFTKSPIPSSSRKCFLDAWNAAASSYAALWKSEASEAGDYERPRMPKEVHRTKEKRGVGAVGDLERMREVSIHFSRMMTLRLAA